MKPEYQKILRMAREQGLPETETEGVFRVNTDDLGRMIAAEREACAKVCDDVCANFYALYKGRPPYTGKENGRGDPIADGASHGAEKCAEAIRARGEK